jgi:hypothetical protein
MKYLVKGTGLGDVSHLDEPAFAVSCEEDVGTASGEVFDTRVESFREEPADPKFRGQRAGIEVTRTRVLAYLVGESATAMRFDRVHERRKFRRGKRLVRHVSEEPVQCVANSRRQRHNFISFAVRGGTRTFTRES